MGLKTVVKSLDGMSDDVVKFYTKAEDGRFVLDLDGIDDHPLVSGLSKTKTKERESRKEFEKKYKELSSQLTGIDLSKIKNIDPDKYEKALKDLEALKDEEIKQKRKKLKDKESWEKLELEIREESEKKMQEIQNSFESKFNGLSEQLGEVNKTKEKELSSMEKTLSVHLKDKEIVAALADAKGNRLLLEPHISKLVKVVKIPETGEYAARVFNDNGDERFDNLGKPLSIKELVEEFREKPEFQGEGIFEKEKKEGGSGSSSNNSDDDTTKNPFAKGDDFNLTEQARLTNSDPVLAAKLREQASNKG